MARQQNALRVESGRLAASPPLPSSLPPIACVWSCLRGQRRIIVGSGRIANLLLRSLKVGTWYSGDDPLTAVDRPPVSETRLSFSSAAVVEMPVASLEFPEEPTLQLVASRRDVYHILKSSSTPNARTCSIEQTISRVKAVGSLRGRICHLDRSRRLSKSGCKG